MLGILPGIKKVITPKQQNPAAIGPRHIYLSETYADARVTTYAHAYGGMVNSYAARPVYPIPWTIVGAKSDRDETPIPMQRYVI